MKFLRIVIQTLVLAVVWMPPLYAYVTSRQLSSTNDIVQIRWATEAFPVTWQMNPTPGANVTGARAQDDVVRQSFQTWSSIPTAAISFREGPVTSASTGLAYDGQNVISTNVTSSEWAALGVGSGVLAFTVITSFDMAGITDPLGRRVSFPGQIMEADIVFNPGYLFGTDDQVAGEKFDLQSVLTHEIGHFLGLDHSPVIAATMFWTISTGRTARQLSADDVAGVSSIYPTSSFLSKGTISGTVKTTAMAPVYGAIVVAINANGQPVASALTDPNGQYVIMGLEPGAYTVYAEPLDGPTESGDVNTLSRIYPGQEVNTSFTTRFR